MRGFLQDGTARLNDVPEAELAAPLPKALVPLPNAGAVLFGVPKAGALLGKPPVPLPNAGALLVLAFVPLPKAGVWPIPADGAPKGAGLLAPKTEPCVAV